MKDNGNKDKYKVAVKGVYKNDVLAKRLGGESQLQVYNINMAESVIPEESKGIERGIENTIPRLVFARNLMHKDKVVFPSN